MVWKLLKRPAAAKGALQNEKNTPCMTRANPTLMLKNAPENSTPLSTSCLRPPLMLKNKQDDQVSLLKRRRVGLEVQVVNGVAAPTSEWRVVPPGVPCPGGCEYRMDLASGKNMIRLLPSKTGRTESFGTQVVAVDETPSPCRKRQRIVDTGNSLQSKQSPKACRARPVPKSVEKEHKQTKSLTRKDGTRELARTAVKSREVVRPSECGKPGNRQKVTSRRDERVRKLGDGRTVITETITLQKVTVLAN